MGDPDRDAEVDVAQVKSELCAVLQKIFNKKVMQDNPYLSGVLVDNFGVPLEALILCVHSSPPAMYLTNRYLSSSFDFPKE